jgi:Family of unknown function (DUF6221)
MDERLMTHNMQCPACESYTSSVLADFENAEPCRVCQLPNEAASAILATRARSADAQLTAQFEEAITRATRAEVQSKPFRSPRRGSAGSGRAVREPGEAPVRIMDIVEFLLARIVLADASGESFGWYDPNRVLAECEAKRRIIDGAAEYFDHRGGIESTDGLAGRGLSYLALPYANHPDYRAGWAPEEARA